MLLNSVRQSLQGSFRSQGLAIGSVKIQMADIFGFVGQKVPHEVTKLFHWGANLATDRFE